MRLTDRLPYQAIVDRPQLALPEGKRLAVWVILNVEDWGIEQAAPLGMFMFEDQKKKEQTQIQKEEMIDASATPEVVPALN